MDTKRLNLIKQDCFICESADAEKVGAGKDFEYRTTPDTFVAVRCNSCGLVYLNPRPAISDFDVIYPSDYHAFDFSEKEFGFVHKVRSWLEAKRLLALCKKLPADARILDVGCGDGFHLRLLRDHGESTWLLEGIDVDERAVCAAAKQGLTIHHGEIENAGLAENAYDLVFMIQTIEHVDKPDRVLGAVLSLLKPGGELVIVTDNTGSLDFGLFKKGYWGGYHFPRHWNLFDRKSLAKLAGKVGFEVAEIATQVTPVNWVYSIHNVLADKGAPRILTNRFTLRSTMSLSAFTSLDMILQKLGSGGLLRAVLRKPKRKDRL